jgi:superfamily II DNA or RNA helicase
MLEFYDELRVGGLVIPRGFIRQLISLCKREGVSFHIEYRRRTLLEVDFTFLGELKQFQREAVKEILERDFATISAPTGCGKTVMALSLIGQQRKQGARA